MTDFAEDSESPKETGDRDQVLRQRVSEIWTARWSD